VDFVDKRDGKVTTAATERYVEEFNQSPWVGKCGDLERCDEGRGDVAIMSLSAHVTDVSLGLGREMRDLEFAAECMILHRGGAGAKGPEQLKKRGDDFSGDFTLKKREILIFGHDEINREICRKMIQTWIDNSHIDLGLLDAAGKAKREYGENERTLMGMIKFLKTDDSPDDDEKAEELKKKFEEMGNLKEKEGYTKKADAYVEKAAPVVKKQKATFSDDEKTEDIEVKRARKRAEKKAEEEKKKAEKAALKAKAEALKKQNQNDGSAEAEAKAKEEEKLRKEEEAKAKIEAERQRRQEERLAKEAEEARVRKEKEDADKQAMWESLKGDGKGKGGKKDDSDDDRRQRAHRRNDDSSDDDRKGGKKGGKGKGRRYNDSDSD